VDRSTSLSRQLVLAVALPLVLSFAVTIAVLDGMFRASALRALRERLGQEVVSLVTAAELNEDGRMELRLLDPDSRLSRPHSGQYAQVRNERGRVLWSSPSMYGVPIHFSAPVATGGTAFSQQALADGSDVGILERGLEWDYAPGHSARLVFSVAEDLAAQNARLRQFRRRLYIWFAALALLLLAVLGGLLRRVLRPLRRLEREIEEVDGGSRARLGAGYPRELAGVAGSLNALLGSEQQRIRRYRDTLGNLAHSLKTPLAVMRASLGGGPEQGAAINQEIDRMARIVERQLQRAAASGGATLGQPTVALAPVVAELRAAMLKVHARKDLVIETEVGADAGFVGDRGDLTELLGNLLDNACKWCRGVVRVRAWLDPARPQARSLMLRVEDDGPGIAPADRERVLGRGERADERAPGHGLGLAMVADTVALYRGELVLGESALLHGASVELALPGRAPEGAMLKFPA
jgi:two-component system, OmpR family, sensor histidine kinase PhoQ